jgi:hypothetical protein
MDSVLGMEWRAVRDDKRGAQLLHFFAIFAINYGYAAH